MIFSIIFFLVFFFQFFFTRNCVFLYLDITMKYYDKEEDFEIDSLNKMCKIMGLSFLFFSISTIVSWIGN